LTCLSINSISPDFKTIADVRRDNGPAIRNVCRQFIVLCRELKLFADAMVAIDGSKFKAVNNRDKNFTTAKMERRMANIEESIARYPVAMDTADRAEPEIAKLKKEHLQDKITALKKRMAELKEIDLRLKASPDQQVSLTNPDARSMKTREGGIVGYNVQTAFDTKHHLIVAHEVITDGVDRDQLTPMAEQAREATGMDALSVVADRGYFKGEQIRQCEQAGIVPIVPKPLTSGNLAAGRFDKQDFIYLAQDDEYRCPADQRAIYRSTAIERGLTLHRYWSSACPQCAMKARCTTSAFRRITRWEHEDVLERMLARLDRQPEMMRVRRETLEHPFGTLKHWMGSTHFLTKTLPRVSTEMSVHVLAYNLKRVMHILGMKALMTALMSKAVVA
jgi:transposase